MGWAIRKRAEALRARIGRVLCVTSRTSRAESPVAAQYMKTIRALNNAAAARTGSASRTSAANTSRKYGNQYKSRSPRCLAAQDTEESTAQSEREEPGRRRAGHAAHARDRARSSRSATSTRSSEHRTPVAKYMDQLMSKNFPDAKFDEQNRTLFAFASYNAGPGNISKDAQGKP